MMSTVTDAESRFGRGPLGRVAALIYTLLIVEILLLLTAAPGLIPLVLLDRDASNVPLIAACAVPLGPALSAALYALHHRRLDLTDLHPGTAFWRGYRLNVLGVLQLWVPFLVLLTIIAVNLTHLGAAGIPTWWAVLLGIVAALTALWVANVLVITSLFAFRARDVARLAVYFLIRRGGVTLANLCLLVVAAALTALTSELITLMVGVFFVAALLQATRPMIDQVRRDFTE
jgi:uncharacterized membrane protein YesL